MNEAPESEVPGLRTSAAATGPRAAGRRPRPRRRTAELSALALVGVLLVAALAAGGAVLYREFYSPSAFVERYLAMLGDGQAAEARLLPGVDVDAVGVPASEALLRRDALTTLTEVSITSEESGPAGTRVTAQYRAGDVAGTTTFDVVQDGWIGVVPSWRFATSPLTVMNVTVRGSMQFAVNGFEVDKRQVSPDGMDADPLSAVPMLVFSPGLYSVDVDTAISTSPGVAVLADAPLAEVNVDLQAAATEEFIGVVQQHVNDFLTACATQRVLQPTGCPFGFQVRNRVMGEPTWSIAQLPEVSVEPDGAGWRIQRAEAVAHIDVEVRLLFDGSLRSLSEDVRFAIEGTIDVLPDGTVSIRIGGENAG